MIGIAAPSFSEAMRTFGLGSHVELSRSCASVIVFIFKLRRHQPAPKPSCSGSRHVSRRTVAIERFSPGSGEKVRQIPVRVKLESVYWCDVASTFAWAMAGRRCAEEGQLDRSPHFPAWEEPPILILNLRAGASALLGSNLKPGGRSWMSEFSGLRSFVFRSFSFARWGRGTREAIRCVLWLAL